MTHTPHRRVIAKVVASGGAISHNLGNFMRRLVLLESVANGLTAGDSGLLGLSERYFRHEGGALEQMLQIYAATSGVANVRHAGELDVDLFTGLIMVYEPGFPNAPEFTWEQKHTEEIWREAAAFIRSKGLEAWAKPSGRGLDGRSKEGQWDYGILATLMDGMNVQTQGSCRNDTYSQALYDLVSQYEALGATSDLLVQFTVGTNARHGVLAPKAIDCAKEAWDKVQIDRVTLWPDMSDQREVEDYLELKEKLQAQEE
jgi:hypothetical protein